jgi:Tol biopolymer transport system component
MSAFDNMPDVGKKKIKVNPPPQQKRTPMLLAALAGLVLLLLCLLLASTGAWYFTLGPGASAQKVGIAVPPGSAPTTPSASSAASTQGVKIAYSVYTGDSPEGHSIWIMNADGSDAKQLIRTASSPVFSPDGKQIAYYHYTDGIYVANADGTGAHKIVGETNAKYLAWSHDGTWIAFASKPAANQPGNVNIDAIRVDGSGRRTIVIGGSMPSWSPNDQQIAFADCRGADCGILTASALGGDEGSMIVKELGTDPAWSPNGNTIVYQADVDSIKQLFVVNVDGTGKKQLTSGTAPHVDAVWSPDGNTIFYRTSQSGDWGIWKMNADGSSPVKLIGNVEPVDWAFERLAVAP